MQVSVLASGSSGNSFFCQADGASLLIDAGISCKQIRERLTKIGKKVSDIDGIFVTHEHIDHIRAIPKLTKDYNIPLYMTKGTFSAVGWLLDEDLVNMIRPGKAVDVKGCIVKAFGKSHDCREPVSFIVRSDKSAGFITDIGIACRNVKKAVRESELLVLESNHDEHMLQSGPYPSYLKKRIGSERGHLSNYGAALLVLEHAPPALKHVLLAHLSLVNNTDELALHTFKTIVRQRKDLRPKVSLTYRHLVTPLLKI